MYTYTFTKEIRWGYYDIDDKGQTDEFGNPILLVGVLAPLFPDYPPTVAHVGTSVRVTFDHELGADDLDTLLVTVEKYKAYKPSKIENIYKNWENLYIDYKKARCEMQVLVVQIGWDGLTTLEKRIASMWFVVPVELRNLVHTQAEQVLNGKTFHTNSVNARKKRSEAAVSAMYNYLSMHDAFEVVDDVVNTYNLIGKYTQYGREGMIEDGMPGLFDYLESRDISMFSGIGLASKGFVPSGIPLSILVTAAMGILKYGNYS